MFFLVFHSNFVHASQIILFFFIYDLQDHTHESYFVDQEYFSKFSIVILFLLVVMTSNVPLIANFFKFLFVRPTIPHSPKLIWTPFVPNQYLF